MLKSLCLVFAVLGLASAAVTHKWTQITSMTVSTDTTAIGDLAATTFARAYSGESFTFTIKGYGIGNGDRIAWVKNADSDCSNAASGAGVPAVALSGCTYDAAGLGTCTSAATSVVLPKASSASTNSGFNGYMRLCYSSQAVDAYGNALATSYPWQYYGNYFRFGIANVDSWASTGDANVYYSAAPYQRFWGSQKTGSGTVLAGQNIFDNDKIQAVVASGSATATCANSVSWTTCGTGSNECTTITSSKFTSDITFQSASAKFYFLCYNRANGAVTSGYLNSFDTGLRAQSVAFSLGNSLQFAFPYQSPITSAAGSANFASGQIFRVGMFAVRGGDKFFFTIIGTGNYLTCSAIQTNVAVSGNPWFTVSAIEYKSGIRTAKLSSASTTVSFTNAGAVTNAAQLTMCYFPEGTGVSGGTLTSSTNPLPWYTTFSNCDPGSATGYNDPSTGAAFLMANDFTVPTTAGVDTVLLAGVANNVFFAGCTTANGYYGVSALACTNSPAGTETGLAKITDVTWPQITITPLAASGTTYKLCGNGASVMKSNGGSSTAITYNVAYSNGGNAITRAATGSATNDIFIAPSTHSSKTTDLSAKWFMSGWNPYVGAGSLGSALNYWTGDNTGTAATKYNGGTGPISGTIKTDVIFTTSASTTDEFACSVDAVNAVRYGSTINTAGFGSVDGSADSWIGKTNLRTAAAITCDNSAVSAAKTQTCLLGTSSTPDVAKKTQLTMCVRIYDGTSYVSTWMRTKITVTQYPMLNIFPSNKLAVPAAAGNTPNFYINGIDPQETGLKIGIIDIAQTGATTGNLASGSSTAATSRCAVAAAVSTVTGGKVAFAAAASANSGQLYTGTTVPTTMYFCITRDADTDPYLYQRYSGGGLTTSSTYTSPTGYTITDYAGTAQTLSPTGDNIDVILTATSTVKLTASFGNNDIGLDDSTQPKISGSTSDCTGGTVDVATGTTTWTNTWTQADNGNLLSTQTVSTSFTLTGASTATGVGVICWNKNVHYAGALRIVKVNAACSTASCDGSYTPASTSGWTGAVKVDTFGSYILSGAAPSKDIVFEVVNGLNTLTTDKAVFYPATATGTPTFTNTIAYGNSVALTDAPTNSKAVVASGWTWNNMFPGTAASGDVTGVYNLWLKSGRAGAVSGYMTAATLTVVSVTGRYPASWLSSEGTTMYLAHTGVTGGNLYLTTTTGGCTAATTFTSSATTFPPSGTSTQTVTYSATTKAATIALATATVTADTVYKVVCYQGASGNNYFVAADWTGSGPTMTVYNTAAAVASDLPVASLGANLYTLEKQVFPFTINLATAATGVGYIQEGYTPLLIDGTKTCNNDQTSSSANAALATGTKKNAETNTAASGSTVTFPSTLASGKATNYKVCWPGKKAPSAATDWPGTLATTVNVRQMPNGLAWPTATPQITGSFVLVANADSSFTQKFTLTYAGTPVATDKLQGSDTACLVTKGRAGPATSAAAQAGYTTPSDTTGAYAMLCVVVGASDTLDFTSLINSQTATSLRGDYDLWVAAQAVAGSLAIPAQVAGVTVTIVLPQYRPYYAFSGAARTFFSDVAGDSYTITTTATATDCGGLSNYAATTGSGNTISFTATPTGSAGSNNYICFSPAKNSGLKVPVQQKLKVYDATADGSTDTLAAASVFGPDSNRAFYVQDNVNTPYTFPYATSGAQPGDIFKVIKYEIAFATSGAKTCASTLAASDTYADNTVSGGWAAPTDASASMWFTLAKLPATSGATGSTNQNMPLCWLQKGSASTPPQRDTPGSASTALGVRVVDVNMFHIVAGSVKTLTINSYALAPRAIGANTRFTAFFGGHWLDVNDAVSFVPASSSDCTQAWYYENLFNGPTPTASTPTMISAVTDFYTGFEGGLPGGAFYLCYASWHTKTGYRYYSDLPLWLRSIEASILPLTASSGISTTFTLTPYSHDQLQYTYWRNPNPSAMISTLVSVNDRAQFILNTAACSTTNTSNSVNFTATSSITATLSTANPTDTFQPCVDFYSGPMQQAIACNVYGQTCGMTAGGYSPFVTVYSSAKVVTTRPATIARGRPTNLVFHGSFLNKGGFDGVYLNTTASCNGTFTPLANAGNPAEQNQAQWPNYVQQVPGSYAVCYQFFLNATTPVATGLNVIVAGVDSIAPTGIDAAPFLAGTASLTITLTGYFNQFQSANWLDNDYIGLIPRVAAMRDCSGVNVTQATTNPVTLSSSTSGTVASFDITDAPAAGDYSFCVHFAGMPWTGVPANDFVLLDQSKVTFSVRKVMKFLPTSIVNNTQAVVSFFGPGLGNDTVGWVASTADCTAAAPATTAQAAVVGGKATINVNFGTYRLCYKFKDSSAWFNVLTATDLLTATNPIITSVAVRIGGVAAAQNTWDMTDSARIVLSGTGLSTGDKARLVNNTATVSCSGLTGWVPVVPDDLLNNANYFINAPAGSIANGSYVLCYQWASGILQNYSSAAFVMTVTNKPKVLGIAPRMVNLASSASFMVIGQGLSGTDKASLVAAGTTCPAAGAAQVSNILISDPARTVVNITLAITGATGGAAFDLCYYPAGAAAGSPGQKIGNAVWVVDPSVSCTAAGAPRYRCGVTCQNAPCTPTNAPSPLNGLCANNPLAVICPGSAFCGKSSDDCFALAASSGATQIPCPAIAPQRCFDGSCSLNLLTCPPVSAPGAGVRCADGTLASASGACGVTTKACTGITGTNTYCAASGGCPIGGVADLTQCPPADGCPVGLQRCSDCTCQTDCTPLSFPFFQCADGSKGTTKNDCQRCWRHAKFIPQTVSIRAGTRRRFVVRGSIAFSNLNLQDNNGNVVVSVASIDANLAKDDGCTLGIYSVAESVADTAYGFTTNANGFLAGPTVYIGIMNNASLPCNLDSTKFITISYPALETQGPVTCGVYIGNGTVTTVPPSNGNPLMCKVSGSTLLGVGIAPYAGTVAPKTVVVPNPAGTGSSPSASAVPSTGVPTGPAGTGTAVPTGPASTSSAAPSGKASGSVALSASSVLVAIALSLLALLI